MLDTLNREAVKSFYEEITKNPSNGIDSREDLHLGNALGETGITCSDRITRPYHETVSRDRITRPYHDIFWDISQFLFL